MSPHPSSKHPFEARRHQDAVRRIRKTHAQANRWLQLSYGLASTGWVTGAAGLLWLLLSLLLEGGFPLPALGVLALGGVLYAASHPLETRANHLLALLGQEKSTDLVAAESPPR